MQAHLKRAKNISGPRPQHHPGSRATTSVANMGRVRRVINYGDKTPDYNSSDDLSPVTRGEGETTFLLRSKFFGNSKRKFELSKC